MYVLLFAKKLLLGKKRLRAFYGLYWGIVGTIVDSNEVFEYGGWIVSKVQSLFWRRVPSLRRGAVSTGGGAFHLENTLFVEECVLISRRGSSSSGVGT